MEDSAIAGEDLELTRPGGVRIGVAVIPDESSIMDCFGADARCEAVGAASDSGIDTVTDSVARAATNTTEAAPDFVWGLIVNQSAFLATAGDGGSNSAIRDEVHARTSDGIHGS